MADEEKDHFKQMLGMWQEGQEAFLKAQSEAMDNFSEFISDMQGQAGEADDPMAIWNGFIKSWAPDWDANQFMTGMENLNKRANPFFAMLEPANWTKYAPEQLRTILESIAAGPRFADLATPQYEAATAWRETLDYSKASGDMAKVMHDAWTRAYGKYSEEHTLEDMKTGEVEKALNAWLSAANAELLEVQRSPEYLDAQKRMIRASTEIKARQKEIAEAWSEQWQIPTRTEVDDLTRTVHELRREVRMLKRELSSRKERNK